VPLQRAWARHVVQRHQIRQRDELARAIRAHEDVAQIRVAGALLRPSLQHHVVLFAVDDVGGDLAFAHQSLERRADAAGGDAEARGSVLVDAHEHLRLRLAQIGVEPQDAGILGRARENDVAPARELLVVRATEHDLDRVAAAATAAAVAAAQERVDTNVGNLLPLPVEVVEHFLRRDLALAERFERDVHDTGAVVAPTRHADDAALDAAVVEVLL
jgi:hypothetical protein